MFYNFIKFVVSPFFNKVFTAFLSKILNKIFFFYQNAFFMDQPIYKFNCM